MISQRAKVESQGDQPRQFASYSGRRPTQRELLGAARCGPEELKGPFLLLPFIGSQDDWLQASEIFHPGRSPHDTNTHQLIILEVQARIQCWLVLGLLGGRGGWGECGGYTTTFGFIWGFSPSVYVVLSAVIWLLFHFLWSVKVYANGMYNFIFWENFEP